MGETLIAKQISILPMLWGRLRNLARELEARGTRASASRLLTATAYLEMPTTAPDRLELARGWPATARRGELGERSQQFTIRIYPSIAAELDAYTAAIEATDPTIRHGLPPLLNALLIEKAPAEGDVQGADDLLERFAEAIEASAAAPAA